MELYEFHYVVLGIPTAIAGPHTVVLNELLQRSKCEMEYVNMLFLGFASALTYLYRAVYTQGHVFPVEGLFKRFSRVVLD